MPSIRTHAHLSLAKHVLVALIPLVGCAHQNAVTRHTCHNPDRRLESAVGELILDERGCVDDDGNPRCEEAMHELERLTQICPEHAPTREAAFEVAMHRGDLETARRHASSMRLRGLRGPLDRSSTLARARVAIESGNPARAIEILQARAATQPGEYEVQEMLAGAYYVLGQYHHARRSLERATNLGAPESRTLYHRALIDEICGRPNAARDNYRRAYEADPSNRVAELRARSVGTQTNPGTASAPASCTPVATPSTGSSLDAALPGRFPAPPDDNAPAPTVAPSIETRVIDLGDDPVDEPVSPEPVRAPDDASPTRGS